MINEIIGKTQKVIALVAKRFPDDFPKSLAMKIFQGMIEQSEKLAE